MRLPVCFVENGKGESSLRNTAEEEAVFPYCPSNNIELNYLWMIRFVTLRNIFNLVLKPLSGN